MPALLRAHEIGARVAAVGFDWPRAADVVDKIEEEVAELRRAVDGEGLKRTEEEMGDLLFAIANLSRKLGIEPESALRMANDKFTKRFTALEGRVHDSGRSVREMSLEDLESEWNAVKEEYDSRHEGHDETMADEENPMSLGFSCSSFHRELRGCDFVFTPQSVRPLPRITGNDLLVMNSSALERPRARCVE